MKRLILVGAFALLVAGCAPASKRLEKVDAQIVDIRAVLESPTLDAALRGDYLTMLRSLIVERDKLAEESGEERKSKGDILKGTGLLLMAGAKILGRFV